MAKSKGKSKNKTNTKSDKHTEQTGNKLNTEIKEKEETSETWDENVDDKMEIVDKRPQDYEGSSSTKPEHLQKKTDWKENKERDHQKRTSEVGGGSDNNNKFQNDYNTPRKGDPPIKISAQNREKSTYNKNNTDTKEKEMWCDSTDDKAENSDKEVQDEGSSTKFKPYQKKGSKGSGERYSQKETETGSGSKGCHFNNNERTFNTYKSESDRARSRRSEPPIKIGAQNRENFDNKSKPRRSVNENVRDTRKRPRGNESYESEFRIYEEEFRKTSGDFVYERTIEIEQDLFMMSNEYSLAHCVAEDMSMGSGIAVNFRYKFKRVDELLNQHQTPGGLAVLNNENRYIYYLVTKKHSTGKPTYRTLFSSLQQMRKHIEEHKVKKLAMPTIGCGLDRLEWKNVKFMIEYIFKDLDVDIVICNLQQGESSPQSRHRNCKQVNVTYPIHKIEEGTIIVYLSSEEGYISEEMKLLDEKFHFLTEFKNHRKRLRDTILFTRNKDYLLAGCIVKKSDTDPVDFEALQECVLSIMRTNNKYHFSFLGFQATKDERDSCINYKIINILRNSSRNVEVYICWPGELEQEMSARDRFNDSFTATSANNDKYESRDSSGQKPYRQNSFSRKDKRNTNEEDNNWRNSSRSDFKKGGSFRKSLFESPSRNSYSKEVSNDKQNEVDDKPSTSQENVETDWFEESKSPSTKQSRKNEAWPVQEKTETSFETLSPKRKNELSDQTIPPTMSESKNTSADNSVYEKYKQEPKSGNFTKVKMNSPCLPQKYSQVCYVTEDMCLQSAISAGTSIGTLLGDVLNQNQKEGSCAFVKNDREYLYCLIVKKLPNSTYKHDVVFSSLQHLKSLVVKHRTGHLVIPMIKKSRNESFDWSEIPNMAEFLFQGTSVEVHLVPFSHEVYLDSLKKRNSVTLNHVKHPLFQMKKKSMIIYWASEDGAFSDDMVKMKGKFDFENDFQKAEKQMGKVIRYKENEDHVLYGCVVRKTQNGPINFVALQRCISIVSDTNTEELAFAAASAVEDNDETVNYKIVHILLNNLRNVSVSFCWSGSLRDKMPSRNG